jgi:acetylornithine aminotransferase
LGLTAFAPSSTRLHARNIASSSACRTAAAAMQLASGAVKEVRGEGLMIGVDLSKPCGALVQRAADAGLLISVTADSVVRLVPPLILSEAEADQIVTIIAPLIASFLKEAA